MEYSEEDEEKIEELVAEFVKAALGHSMTLLIEDDEGQSLYIRRGYKIVDQLKAIGPDAVLALAPLMHDDDTFIAVKAAGHLSLVRPDAGLPMLNYLHDTTRGREECVFAGQWLDMCEKGHPGLQPPDYAPVEEP